MKKGTPPMLEMSISESALQDFNLPLCFTFRKMEKKLDDEF